MTGMRRSVVARVQALTDAQLGTVTSAQLREAGLDAELPRREGWLRLADGTWAVHDDPTDEQLLAAAQLYAPGAVPSGALACRWWELRHAPDAAGLDALVQHGRTLLGGPLLRMKQTRRMPTGVEYAHQLVAGIPRSLADAARWSTQQDARAVVLAALADRRVSFAALRDEADAGPFRTGRRLATALTDWERGARSAPEAEAADALLALMGGGGALPFLLNPELWLHGRLIGSPDGYLVGTGLGWEMDSREFHGDLETLDQTLSRHQGFSDVALELLHTTPSRFRSNRAAWAADVARRARRRIAEGRGEPAGLVVVPKGPVLGLATAAA